MTQQEQSDPEIQCGHWVQIEYTDKFCGAVLDCLGQTP